MNALKRVLWPTMAVPYLLVCMALVDDAEAQVRTNLRANMQIDTLGGSSSDLDQRWWPLKINALAPGDVDGDGDLDLLMADNDDDSRIWLNDGDGVFRRFVTLLTGSKRCCALFDADGDGDLDALLAGGRTAYEGPGLTVLFRNDGNAVFVPSSTIPTLVARIQSLLVGDLDGDGDDDIVLVPGDAPVSCWRNDGAGTFTDQTTAVGLSGVLTGSSVRGTLVDVEPDGDLDLAFTYGQVFVNDGGGVFAAAAPMPYPGLADGATLADVDGDGLTDRLAVDGNVPSVHLNVGSGLFQDVSAAWFEPHTQVVRTVGYWSAACVAFDVDGDRDVDLVTGGVQGRGTTSTTVGIPPKVFLNRDGAGFVEAGRSAFPMAETTVTAMTAGDVDGDGDVDLLLAQNQWYASGPWTSALLWKQDAAGRFLETPAGISIGDVSSLTLADVDADGDLDLVSVFGWGPLFPGVPGQHRLALNDGTGQFVDVTTTRMPATAVSGGAASVAGDVDGDGDLDLVIGSYHPNWGGPGVPLMLLLNDGAGVFTDASSQLAATPFSSGHLAMHDFDSDGDLDLVVAADPNHASATSMLFLVNDGSGTFHDETSQRIPASPGATGLSVLDLDGDGDLDIAQSTADFWNDGNGYFALTTSAPRLLTADFDEDGVADDVARSNGITIGGRVVWQDVFSDGHLLLPFDLDHDGDLDLAVAPLRAGGSPDWFQMRVELIYNLRRDLRVVSLPRIGQPYRVQLRATNGVGATGVVLALATATLQQPVPLFDWGQLVMDPGAIVPFAVDVVPDADTSLEASLTIPNQLALVGLPLTAQALFLPQGSSLSPHLSNAMTFAIER